MDGLTTLKVCRHEKFDGNFRSNKEYLGFSVEHSNFGIQRNATTDLLLKFHYLPLLWFVANNWNFLVSYSESFLLST